jgi:outer membrane lipoprotein carrier protein
MRVDRITSCYTLGVSHRTTQCRLAAAIILFVAGFPLPASGPYASDSPDSAKTIARLLEQHYRNTQTLRAVFLERYSEGPRQAQIESGTVYFRRPGRMRWEYEAPERKLFIADGKTVWFYVPYDHTVTKAPVKESSDWRTPLALLTGKVEISRLCSRIDLITQSGVPAAHAILRCFPKGLNQSPPQSAAGSTGPPAELPGEADFTDVLLEVDRASGELERIEIRQPGGIELEYRFGDWQEGLPLPESMFQFQVPVGVAIVDASALPSGPQ